MRCNHTINVLGLVRRFRLLLFVPFAVTFVLLLYFYQETSRHVRYGLFSLVDFSNGKHLLTISMDEGRLGNKMFKYASLLGIAEREGRTPFVRPWRNHEEFEHLFPAAYLDPYTKYSTKGWPVIAETDYAYYDPVFTNLSLTNLKIGGFLQSWKYFQNVEQRVRQEFRLSDKMKTQADDILNTIHRNSIDSGRAVTVGVHVRRFNDEKKQITTKTPKAFFVNSFEKMKSLLPGQRVIFVVAGDDLDWCKENLSAENVTILEPASTEVHFSVLASCQHFIVSGGTFGWWAGWLTGGRVIFYKKFPTPESYQFKGFHYEDYYPPSWIPVGD